MSVRVINQISRGDQFLIYDPRQSLNKGVTYITLLNRLRADLNLTASSGGGVTSVDLTAGTGISVSGGPITTAGSITVTNTAPDQVVVLNSGTGINVTGTYPTFTIAATGGTGTVTSIATTAPIQGGTITTSGTISITQSGASTDGYLSSTDWNAFNSKASDAFKTIAVSGQSDVVADSATDTLTLVAGTNITITTDASTDTITINSPDAGGTVTNISTSAPITGGPITTTGTIGITQSGASTDGYLSSTDWNAFNSKEPALTKGDLTETTSAILTITGGTNAVIGSGTTIAVSQASTSASGYLSSTDWNTFNGKQDALTFGDLTETTSSILTITGGTNAVIGSGTTIAVTQASASTNGFLSSADWTTFNNKQAALTKGNLTEATSAVLTITGGTGAVIGSGTSIQVSQSSPSTSGYLSSADWNKFNGKADYSFVTIAVSGQTDVVADSRSDTLTLVAGTGVTITTDAIGDSVTIAATGGGGGTVTSVATSAPLSGGPITTTGTISITQSNTTTDGYLSSTDWNTFNGKQDALTFGNLTEATSAVLTITGGTGAVVGSGATIEVLRAGPTTSGYLSSTDWNTFERKASYAFKTISVSGQSDIVADAADDTLTVAAGTGITLATTAASDTLTITNSAPDQTVTLTAGTGISISGAYPSFTITGTAQSNYTNLISAQVGESNSETTKSLTYGTLYSLSARAGTGALTQSTPVMDMYHFNKVIYDGSGGDQTALLSSAFYLAAINGDAVPTTTDLIGADFVYNSQMAAMMTQNHFNQQANIDLSQVEAILTIVGTLRLAAEVNTRLIVVHFGQYINLYDESGGSAFINKRPSVWQYGYSAPLGGPLTEKFFGLTMANDDVADLPVSTAMSGWGFALVNTENPNDYTSVATLENSSLIRIRCREEYYTTTP